MNGAPLFLAIVLSLATGIANASFYGDTVSGQLSDPWATQLFDSDTALVGDGDEFTGSVSCCGGSTLQYYTDVGLTSITIGIRHQGPFGFVFNANPFTFQISGLDWDGPGILQGFALGAVFTQQLWPGDQDPNAAWIGWGQDTPTAPMWASLWDPGTNTLTLVATEGFTIPPYHDVYATFDAIVPIPPSLPLMLSALLALIALQGRGARDS